MNLDPEILARMGVGRDSLIAHISPEEAAILKMLGGSGTVNPKTGFLQFAPAMRPAMIGPDYSRGDNYMEETPETAPVPRSSVGRGYYELLNDYLERYPWNTRIPRNAFNDPVEMAFLQNAYDYVDPYVGMDNESRQEAGNAAGMAGIAAGLKPVNPLTGPFRGAPTDLLGQYREGDYLVDVFRDRSTHKREMESGSNNLLDQTLRYGVPAGLTMMTGSALGPVAAGTAGGLMSSKGDFDDAMKAAGTGAVIGGALGEIKSYIGPIIKESIGNLFGGEDLIGTGGIDTELISKGIPDISPDVASNFDLPLPTEDMIPKDSELGDFGKLTNADLTSISADDTTLANKGITGGTGAMPYAEGGTLKNDYELGLLSEMNWKPGVMPSLANISTPTQTFDQTQEITQPKASPTPSFDYNAFGRNVLGAQGKIQKYQAKNSAAARGMGTGSGNIAGNMALINRRTRANMEQYAQMLSDPNMGYQDLGASLRNILA